jgi:alpha-amylase
MNHPIYFCLALHDHQPVGNFDHVFQQAYEDSYLPFLEVFERYGALKLSLHTSGPLIEWLDAHHPEYLDRLARLVADGRVEILGGAFYEPILTMIPSRDRIGQIKDFTRWLEARLGADVRGMWIPERVWEQQLAGDLHDADIQYTVLDDFHFKNAGLDDEQLDGYFITEDSGRILRVFPCSERLRYLIPFADPHETIEYLRQSAAAHPGCIRVFGDDGEKFGTWPDTKRHVYEHGWLSRFFDLLSENQEWLHTVTLSEAAQAVPPAGKIYLPEGSYREMTEWALPVKRQLAYEELTRSTDHDPRWHALKSFVRGGYWRNFKVKYPETDEMYSRMMMASQRLHEAREQGLSVAALADARRELYRGQCNCGYWHGAFGGAYLPHLRNAIYNHLIAADNLLDQVLNVPKNSIEGLASDFNFDGRPEIQLRNDKLICLLAPSQGGQLYELDVRTICHNLQATLTRRPEAYHGKVLAGHQAQHGDVSSIHDRIVFKQEGLDQRVQYDPAPRKSLLDHFFADDASLESVSRGQATELGDFIGLPYEARLRRNPDRVQAQFKRDGHVGDLQIRITKGVTLNAERSTLEIAYLMEGLPTDRTLHFGIEFNFAGLPAGADDRYFSQTDQRLGNLGSRLDLKQQHDLSLTDEWLGMSVHLSASAPTDIWAFPVETVSQSEGGFELVHQSVVVIPHWRVRGNQQGRWSMTLHVDVDTRLAESRMENAAGPVALPIT